MDETDNAFPPSVRELTIEQRFSLIALEALYKTLMVTSRDSLFIFRGRPRMSKIHNINGCPVLSMSIDFAFDPEDSEKDLKNIGDFIMGENQPLPVLLVTSRDTINVPDDSPLF